MRWERLFADIEAFAAAEERAAFDAEVADLVRAERAALTLVDRLTAQLGHAVGLRLLDGSRLEDVVVDVGPDWLLAGPAGAILVPVAAVVAVEGLGSAAARQGRLARSVGLPVVLRRLARDRQAVRVALLGGGEVTGTIDRVGADHLDVARHALDAPRRPGAVRGVVTVPVGAVLTVRAAAT